MNHDPPPYPHILSATQPFSHFNRPASLRPRNPGATMKRLAWFAVCFLSVVSASAAEFYVSPDGSDENPASVTAPVKSLEKARDLARVARKAKPDEPIQVLLHPGKDYRPGFRTDSAGQDRPLRRRRPRYLAHPGGRRRPRTPRMAPIRSDRRLNACV